MHRKIVALLAAIALAALVWIFAKTPPSTELVAKPEQELVAARDDTRLVAVDAELEDATEPAGERQVERGSVADSVEPSVAPDSAARIHCVVESEWGEPLDGATLTAWASYRNSAGGRTRSRDFDATSDASGEAVAAVDAQPGWDWRFAVVAGDRIRVEGEIGEIEPGAEHDVGVLRMPVGGIIRGRVVDSTGAATGVAWTISTSSAWSADDGGYKAARVEVDSEPESGDFELRGVPPGTVLVEAYHVLAVSEPQATVEIVGGIESVIELRYDGPPPARAINVSFRADVRDVAGNFDPLDLSLLASDGSRRSFESVNDGSSYRVDDLPAGVHSVRFGDPRFAPVEPIEARGGEHVRITLEGNAVVVPRLRDATTKREVDGFQLFTRVQMPNQRSRTIGGNDEPLGGRAPLSSGARVEGIFPFPQLFTLEYPGRTSLTQQVEDIQPGEVRELRFELPAVGEIRGKVLREGSALAVEGAHVSLTRAEQSVASATSDMNGAFHLSAPLGSGELRAWEGEAVSAPKIVQVASTPIEVELRLPPTASYRGRLLAPDWVDFEHYSIRCDTPESARSWRDDKSPRALFGDLTIHSNGEFELPRREHGRYELALIRRLPSSGAFVPPSPPLCQLHPLGSIEIGSGDSSPAEFDLRSTFPAAMTITALENGAPIEYGRVRVQFDGCGALSTWLDESGSAEFHLLPSGSFDVEIGRRKLLNGWKVLLPSSVSAHQGVHGRVEFDLETHPGRLMLAAGDGVLSAGQSVYLESETLSDGYPPMPATLGADGSTLECELPEGRFRARILSADESESTYSAAFDWPAVGGEVEVRFRAESD